MPWRMTSTLSTLGTGPSERLTSLDFHSVHDTGRWPSTDRCSCRHDSSVGVAVAGSGAGPQQRPVESDTNPGGDDRCNKRRLPHLTSESAEFNVTTVPPFRVKWGRRRLL